MSDKKPTTEECSNCRFGNDGECIRHSPVILTAGDWAGSTVHPDTPKTKWCGDYERGDEVKK